MLTWRTLLFVIIGALVISCSSGNANIPSDLGFETIELEKSEDVNHQYKAQEPAIIVLTKPEDLKDIHGLVSAKAETALQKLDFTQEFAIAVFQGRKPTDHYSIQVEQIVKSKDQIDVQARIELPTPTTKKNDIFTSPYHLVKIKKGGLSNQTIVFNLMLGTAVLGSTKSQIP